MFVPLGKFLTPCIRCRSERGATAVEYGLMIAFIAAIIVAAVAILGRQVFGLFSSVPVF
jgi:pilus assembly protein Flp/PilA